MTREEAIKSFKCSNEQAQIRLKVEKMRMDIGEIKELEFYIERDEMAIQALSQEPCADAVSRDAFITRYREWMKSEYGKIPDDDTLAIRVIKSLPSITQKSGKWLITHLSHMAYCSECDYLFKDIPASVVEHFKYCPNCGCRMVATHESEDKE